MAVAYPDTQTAETVRSRLMQLMTEHVIELEDAVVVDREENGKSSCTSFIVPQRSAPQAVPYGVG